MIIGLTGGIACGKSTVAQILVSWGARLVDADQIAREVVLPGSPVLDQVVERFGQDVLLANGELNRKALGAIIFSDQRARQDLEKIMHPPIRATLHQRLEEYERAQPSGLAIADIPLLYESGWDKQLPEVMVVYVPFGVQIKRLMKRDDLNEEQALQRIQAQMPIEEKKRRANIVIDNSGTIEETEQQLADFWQRKGLSHD